MKPDLSYEQCRRLKEWGLEQTLNFGDLYWWWINEEDSTGGDGRTGWIVCVCDIKPGCSPHHEPRSGYVKLPSAEEVWQLLTKKRVSVGARWLDTRWFTCTEEEDEGEEGTEEGLGPALYALCEKVFGEET